MTTASQPLAESPRLGRVHTIRIPEPDWAIESMRADHEDRRDGVSEIIREQVNEDVRGFLAQHDIHVGAREKVTDEHVERLRGKLFPDET